jgi:hypothetical protein
MGWFLNCLFKIGEKGYNRRFYGTDNPSGMIVKESEFQYDSVTELVKAAK